MVAVFTDRQINTAGQFADLRLDQVRCRRGAVWLNPLTVVPKQGGLFLCAGDGNAKGILAGKVKRRLTQSVQHFFNGGRIDRFSFDLAGRVGGLIISGNERERADTVTADLCQHAVCIGPVCADSFGDKAAQLVLVRQQVFKDGRYGCTAIRCLAQGRDNKTGRAWSQANQSAAYVKPMAPFASRDSVPMRRLLR
jgi:hypothetical protein